MKARRMVVVGGGLGGLALALRSALRGWDVTVCERGARLGGKMNTLAKSGFRFDTGPSLITLPSVFEELFAAAGVRLADEVTFKHLSPLARYHYTDGTSFLYPDSLPGWLETIRALEPRDVHGFWRFMRLGSRLYELSRETFFARSPYEVPAARELRALRNFPVRHAWGNYARTVDSHFSSPHLRQLYNRYPTYVGSSPYRAPATLAVVPYIEFAYGGWYVDGGLYSIVKALERLLVKHGVDVRTNAEVVRILHEGGRASGVALAGGEILRADVIAMNGDVSSAPGLLKMPPPKVASGLERSLSAVVFLVGVKRRLPELHHHALYFSADYPREFRELFSERRFPEDPTVYVNVASRTDPTVAPEGSEGLFILANAPSSDLTVWTDGEIRHAWDRVREKLDRSGVPSFDRDIVMWDVWTPSRFASDYTMPGGAIYGLASHSWKTTFYRPSNRDRHIRCLYYVGGSTHPGGGTPMVLLSASIVSKLIDRYERS